MVKKKVSKKKVRKPVLKKGVKKVSKKNIRQSIPKKSIKKFSKNLRVGKKFIVHSSIKKKVLGEDVKIINKIIPKKDGGGFFSKLFGIGGDKKKLDKKPTKLKSEKLDEKLSVPQQKSLELIEEKEHAVLKKLKESKIHPEITKKLDKIDELKKIDEKKGKIKLKTDKDAEGAKVTNTKDPTIVTKDGGEFLKTFIPGFDELLNPGIPKGAAILVEGGPGSGKTLMCLTMLSELCKRGKKVLYMSFEEPEERLRQHINSFGLDAKAYEAKGLLYLKRFNALDIARSVEALLSEAKKELLIDVQPVLIPREFQPDVVILDSLSSISSAFSGESSRFRIYMEQLFRYLESHNINSFLIREVASPTHIGGTFVEQGEAVSFLSDGIVAIYNVIYANKPRRRAIEVLKMRGVNVDRRLCEYEIKGDGVVVHSKSSLKGNYKLT